MECIGVEGQLLGHEADLDHRTYSVLEKPVIDLIDIGEVVDRVPVLILVVDADFIVKDGVKSHIAKAGDLFDCAQIIAVTFAEREDSAARTEHLLPKVGKG